MLDLVVDSAQVNQVHNSALGGCEAADDHGSEGSEPDQAEGESGLTTMVHHSMLPAGGGSRSGSGPDGVGVGVGRLVDGLHKAMACPTTVPECPEMGLGSFGTVTARRRSRLWRAR